MNILQINNIDTRGGAAKVVYRLKRELEKREHTTNLFVKLKFSNDENVKILSWPNPVNRLLKKIIGKDVGSYIKNKVRPWLANDIDLFGTDRILDTKEFKEADIVHCHNLHGNYFSLGTLAKMTALKPVVWTLHDMWAITPHCYNSFDCPVKNGFFGCPSLSTYQDIMWNNERYLRWKKRRVYGQADAHIVTPSLWLKDKVGQSVLKEHGISHIPNGIDERIFRQYEKSSARAELNLPIDKTILMCQGDMGAKTPKGFPYIEETLKRYRDTPDILFVAVGGAVSAQQLSAYPNLRSVSYISDESLLAKYYSAADVFLFTSLAENFPLTILEAMSCGLPIVSFDVGGVKEALLHKENGYIAGYLDMDDFHKGLSHILSLDPNERQLMSENSIQRVREHFTLEKMTNSYLTLYQRLIAKEGQKRHEK